MARRQAKGARRQAGDIPAEASLGRLAGAVGGHLPGRRIASAMLAAPGALEAALAGAVSAPVYPMFLADGWFTTSALPRRLSAAGAPKARILPPFGRDAHVQALAGRLAAGAAAERGWGERETVLILAAHGSGRSSRPAIAARETARRIAAAHRFADIRLGFVEEYPGIAEAAAHAGTRAVCLPLFAAAGGHVAGDVPEALDGAEFAGARLAPLGLAGEAPAMIARTLASALASAPAGAAAIDPAPARPV